MRVRMPLAMQGRKLLKTWRLSSKQSTEPASSVHCVTGSVLRTCRWKRQHGTYSLGFPPGPSTIHGAHRPGEAALKMGRYLETWRQVWGETCKHRDATVRLKESRTQRKGFHVEEGPKLQSARAGSGSGMQKQGGEWSRRASWRRGDLNWTYRWAGFG